MVARTPPNQRKTMVVPLSPTLIRETVKKVDQCMARLQELQYTVTGGNRVVSGVKLSPRSTKAYLKTSLRCKQESLRIRNNGPKKSPTGKVPASASGEWRRMSLPAMLVGETVAEILQASQITKEIMAKSSNIEDPKTPVTVHRKQRRINPEQTPIEARRKREKQHVFHIIREESNTPKLQRARSKINFKVPSPEKLEQERVNSASRRYLANRVSPKHKPWARKTVLFPNPLFHSSPTSQNQKFCKTKSPVIAKKREIPHKFVIKSPVKIKSPQKGLAVAGASPVSASGKPRTLIRKSPPKALSTASKLRRSLSPSRLANRLVSPLKGRRNSLQNSSVNNGDGFMGGLKQRPPALMMMPMRFSAQKTAIGSYHFCASESRASIIISIFSLSSARPACLSHRTRKQLF